MSITERQAELVATHRAIQAADLPFVLVGGWAVSAFQTRFTTDVDMIVPTSAVPKYDSLIRDRDYTKEFDQDVADLYEGRIIRYEKAVGENTVEFDAMVDALRCRQTDAEWSYRYVVEHSVTESLDVAEDLSARIPEPALLFALKLHSGRLADARDLIIISAEADFDNIEQHLFRGDGDALAAQIESVLKRIRSDRFADSFKGVFQQQEVPAEDIDDLDDFLSVQLSSLT